MEILDLEQGSKEWHASRREVITGTRMKSVLGSDTVQQTLIHELIGEALCDHNEEESNAKSYKMEYGSEVEDVLRDQILEGVERVGFIKSNEWNGVSPDGVIYEDGKIVKAIEVKSPGEKNFAIWLSTGGIPKDHIAQVLQYFLVIDTLESLDFIICVPLAKKKSHRIITVNVTREGLEKELKVAKEKVAEFRKKWLSKKKAIIQKIG